MTDSILFSDRVISGKEYHDKKTEALKLTAACQAFTSQQKTSWEAALSDLNSNQVKLMAQHEQLIDEKNQYEVRAPVSGTLQGLSAKYEGGLVQAGEVLCELSPETDLIAECFIETQDIGFLKVNQKVNFSIDAFNYNFFGIITGRVKSIDNDYTTLAERPVFKVRCSFDTSQLQLKNGYRGQLKKGLTIHARFLIARRTIAQLLFDKLDNWLNPTAVNSLK
jgi:HlyD family secretion protein